MAVQQLAAASAGPPVCAATPATCLALCCAVQVNKVAGNFHFAAGHSYQQGSMHIHDMAPFTDKTLDFSHTIRALSFGKPYPVGAVCLGVSRAPLHHFAERVSVVAGDTSPCTVICINSPCGMRCA